MATVAADQFYADIRGHRSIAWEPRPLMSTPASEKNANEKYDLGVARNALGAITPEFMDFMRVANAVNQGFTSGRLWGTSGDIEGYLKDKGIRTSRPALIMPFMTPMLARMLGLLAQVEVHARAESISPEAESRKEKFMNQVLAMSMGASVGPMMQDIYGEMGISGDADADLLLADRNYRDKVVDEIGTYLAVMAQRLKIDQLKYEGGQNCANGGMVAFHGYFRGGYPAVEPLSMEELLLDPAARRRDFSDSSFIGLRKHRDLSDLMEMYEPKIAILKQLESAANNDEGRGPGGMWPWGRPIEHTVYSKDGDYVTKGFVEGANGLEMVVLDEVNPDSGKPRYTIDDCVTPPDNRWTRDWTGKTDRRFVAKLRYCTFLPREYNPSMKEMGDGSKCSDIVLAHGEYEWGEVYPEQEEAVKFPIFRCAWMNIGGMVVAPLTAAQAPQRVMNIVNSDMIHRISRAEGRSTVFDKRALAGQSVKAAAMAVKEGESIELDTLHSGSVANAVGVAGNGMDPTVFQEMELIQKFKEVGESLTHLYDQNFGATGGANELVGVKRLQWQQTSLAQHPYTESVRIAVEQMYEWLANGARRYLMTRPWIMETIIGEKGVKVLLALGDMHTEQVKVKVTLGPDATTVRQAVDETVMKQWLPAELVDHATAAEILNVSTFEKAYAIMKKFNSERAQAQAQAAEAQAQAAQMGQLQEQDAALAQQEGELYNKAIDAGLKAAQIDQKAQAPIVSNMAKNLAPEAAEIPSV